jgi:hypothetical protein
MKNDAATKGALACLMARRSGPASDPIASLPDVNNENRNHRGHDEHPVLAFEPKKSKVLDQKLHASAPISWAE